MHSSLDDLLGIMSTPAPPPSLDPLGLTSFNPSTHPIVLPTARPRRPLLERIDNTDNFVLYIDNSTMEKFDTCQRAAEFYTINRRQGISGAALAFGGALHVGLEHYYKTGDMPTGIERALDTYAPVILRPDEWRTSDFLAHTLQLYHRYYGLSDITPLADGDTPLVELPFAYPLGEIHLDTTLSYSARQLTGEDSDDPLYIKTLHILWSGKIDLIFSHIGQPAIMDHKTSSIDAPTFYDQFHLSQPVRGYAWAASKLLGEPVNMFMLNALIIRKPTRTGTSNDFIRKPYSITAESIDEFLNDVLHKIEAFIHNAITGYFPKSPVWCQSKYGNCQYFNVCTMPKDLRETLLASDTYEDVTWSPLHDA